MLKKVLRNTICYSIPFLITPSITYALGFGEITVFSKLNEPLKAHITLLDSDSQKLDEISVGNASIMTYRHANLPRAEILNKIRFHIRKEANGSAVVELSSKHPFKEPFITFIIEMQWTHGHLNREYTFLLDPPNFVKKNARPKTQKKITPTQQAITSSATKAKDKASLEKKNSKLTKAKNNDKKAIISAQINGNSYGPTQRAETLWEIAKRLRPDNRVSTYQTMQALFALNPHAFIRGNINLLKQGKTLLIPTRDEILTLNNKAKAEAEADAQKVEAQKINSKPLLSRTEESSDYKEQEHATDVSTTSSVDSQTQLKAQEATEIQDEARLNIIPTSEELINKPVVSTNDLRIINKALKTSINSIKNLQSKNKALIAQVVDLEKKVGDLNAQNQELNELIEEMTLSLNEKQSSMEQTSNEQSSSIAGVQTTPSETNDTTALIDIESQVNSKKKSFIREILTNPAITIALTVFTAMLIFASLIFIRKNNEKRKQRKNALNTSKSKETQPENSTPPISNLQPNTSAVNKTPTAHQNSQKENDKDMDFFEYFEKKINTPESKTTEVKTSDKKSQEPKGPQATKKPANVKMNLAQVLNEVDANIAYGNYDKAEELLLSLIQKSPSNKDLNLKLLDCYTSANKRHEFMKHVQKIAAVLKNDIALRHRIENIYQKKWDEALNINKFT